MQARVSIVAGIWIGAHLMQRTPERLVRS